MCGYAAAYVHSFYMLSCVERHVDMGLQGLAIRAVTVEVRWNVVFIVSL
jgi:hypothetical protein